MGPYEPKKNSGEVIRYEYGLLGATLERVIMRLRVSMSLHSICA